MQFYCKTNKVKIVFFLQSYFLIVCCSYVSNNCFNGAFTILQSIFKKEFPELVKSSSYFWIIVLNIIVYPVLLRRKNSDFKVYFLISFFAGIIIIFFISSQYLDDIVNEVKTETQDYIPFKPDGVFSSICLIVFACMCHNDVLEMYHEMKYKNSARFKSVKFEELFNNKVLNIGQAIVFVMYAFISLTGYFYLGNELLLYDFKNILFSYGISFFGKFLLNFLTICIVITHMCIKFRTLKQKATILIRNENRDSNIWHIFIITILHIIQVIFYKLFLNFRLLFHVFFQDTNLIWRSYFYLVLQVIQYLFVIPYLFSSL